MNEITEKEWLIMMQALHLEIIEFAEKELSLIPKEVQKINDRTKYHIKQLIIDLKVLQKNIEAISIHRAKKESDIEIEYKVEEGKIGFGDKNKKIDNNNKKMFS